MAARQTSATILQFPDGERLPRRPASACSRYPRQTAAPDRGLGRSVAGRGRARIRGCKTQPSLIWIKAVGIEDGKRGGRSAPTTVNSSVRTREYLTTAEIERLMAAARKSSRYGHRDATMILIGYRHGLRASELCDLQWSQVELATGRLHVRATRYARCDACSASRGCPRKSL